MSDYLDLLAARPDPEKRIARFFAFVADTCTIILFAMILTFAIKCTIPGRAYTWTWTFDGVQHTLSLGVKP